MFVTKIDKILARYDQVAEWCAFRLAPRPITGPEHNYLSAKKILKLYGLPLKFLSFGCLSGRTWIFTNVKPVAEKPFDVKQNYNEDLLK